jgi:hypothetical protein
VTHPRLVALVVAGLLCACGQAPPAEAPPANRALASGYQGSAPVTDPAAPTVAALRRRGFDRVDDEPAAGPDCGPDCIMEGFSAIYMGPRVARGPADRRFICPVAAGDEDSWRCRPVPETARWNSPPLPPEARRKATSQH